MKIRSLDWSDLRELYHLLDASLAYDSLREDLIKYRVFQDPDFEPALNLVATGAGGQIMSFISAVLPLRFPPGEQESSSQIAWIKVIVTAPEFRKHGYASELFDQIVAELKKRGVTHVRASDRGNWHFWPGVDLRYEDGLDFLEHRGFTRVTQELDYQFDLRRFFYPRRVSRMKELLMHEESLEIRVATPSEKGELGKWIEKKFTVFWRDETERAFSKEIPSVIIAKNRNNTILGFATVDGVAPGRFGPTGVDETMRGRGLGTVLLFDAFQFLKREGREEAVVHWTDLFFFYTQVPGLSGVRHYWIMQKEL